MTSSYAGSLPAFRIRRAIPTDRGRVQNFVFATLRSYNFEPEPTGLDAPVVTFGTGGRDGSALEWVADIAGIAVGAIALNPAGKVAELSVFYVDSSYRGLGVGRALLEHTLEEAKVRGFHQLHLETCTVFREAIHLYEATGWTRGPDLPPGYGPDRTYSFVCPLETTKCGTRD